MDSHGQGPNAFGCIKLQARNKFEKNSSQSLTACKEEEKKHVNPKGGGSNYIFFYLLDEKGLIDSLAKINEPPLRNSHIKSNQTNFGSTMATIIHKSHTSRYL